MPTVMTPREIAIFALRWDVRYWFGQLQLPGADLPRCLGEILKLKIRIDRLEASE